MSESAAMNDSNETTHDMKKIIINSILSSILPMLLMGGVQFVLNLKLSPAGQIIIHPKISLQSGDVQTISIKYWGKNNKKAIFDLYGDFSLLNSGTSNYILTNSIDKHSNLILNIVETDKFQFFTIKFKDNNGWIEISQETKRSFMIGFSEKTSALRIFLSVLPIAILYMIFLFVNNFIVESKTQKTRSKIEESMKEVREELNKEQKRLTEQIEFIEKNSKEYKDEKDAEIVELRKKLSAQTKIQLKYRISLNHHINHLTKELSFWYDVLREIMIKNYGRKETETKELRNLIIKELDSQKNLTRINDPQSIRFYEEMLSLKTKIK